MPSMAKVNNRVINYRDFSFSLRNNFINEYLVLLLSFWREILSRNNDSWTRDRSLTRITLSQMGKKAGNSNVDPATWPNKMEKENNGGLTSDLYLQNNAVSFFFLFFFRFVVLSFRQREDKGLDVRFFFWSQQADVYLSPVALLVALPLTSVHLLCHEE